MGQELDLVERLGRETGKTVPMLYYHRVRLTHAGLSDERARPRQVAAASITKPFAPAPAAC